MSRRKYQESLEELRLDVKQLGELVVGRLNRSLAALEHTNMEAAKSVIEGDDAINQRYLGLESRCIDLFALQQPVAGDLRFIAASFKILTDIERIGDLARNLAQYALSVDRQPISEVAITEIGTAARGLVADALDAYGTQDAASCHRIADRDDHIDALCHSASERVVRDLIEREATEADPWSVEQILDDVSVVLLTIRDLERVADHGVNIAARTLYHVEGDPALLY